jgi:hypothetical protein
MDALRGSLSNAESFGRGFAVAPVGLLGDINALAREYITPRLPANVQGLLQSMPAAPTTERILSGIPRMTAPRMETAGMEQIGSAANPRGPINLGRAVASLPSDVKRAGMEYLQASAQPRQIFVGPNSKTWNKQAADTAVQMEKAGASPRDIWEQTGTFRGAEGKLRQEISDKYSTIKGGGSFEDVIMNAYERGVERTRGTGQREYWQPYKTTVDDVLFHHNLSEAYPELMKIESQLTPNGTGAKGQLMLTDKDLIMQIRPDLQSTQAESTMLHELQHGVQEKEGFAKGGSVEGVVKEANKEAEEIAKKLNEMPYGSPQYEETYKKFLEKRQNITVDQAHDMYKRLAGEAEARLTQARMSLTPEQRLQYFPLEQKSAENPYGLDVNPNELIVLQGLLSP